MKNKAVFLDRDGIINGDYGYVYKIEEFKIIPRVFEALKKLQDAKYKLVIITNQSGIARGFYTEQDFFILDKYIHKIFQEQGIQLEKTYFCPHHSTDGIGKYKIDCVCRKPKPGMILQAAKDYDIDLTNSWLIGDSLRDIEAGKSAGCRTILIGSEHIRDIQQAVDNILCSKCENT